MEGRCLMVWYNFIGQVLLPLLAIIISAICLYKKVGKDSAEWKIELKVLASDLGGLLVANKALVEEVKELVRAQHTIDKTLALVQQESARHGERINNHSDRLKAVEQEVASLKAGR